LLVRMAKKFKIDLFLSVGSAYAALAAALSHKPHIAFDDTEHAHVEHILYRPFSSIICTPSCYEKNFGKKQYRYRGYHELAYLHPSRFSPSPAVLSETGLSGKDTYSLVRFVSWGAIHDRGHHGFSEAGKRRLILKLSQVGRVMISSEAPLSPEMEPFRLPVSPGRLHDILYHSSLYIGEGATMASEAAMLGVPCIYVNPLSAGTLNEQEHRYGLLRQIVDEEAATEMALLIARDRHARSRQQDKQKRMLDEKIDVTAWMVDFIERFPESVHS
jgi:predicted glycosyltransferase